MPPPSTSEVVSAKPGDRGDRRQRLAAKAEGRDADEVGDTADLARRVTVEREDGVLAAHAAAVVAHLDQRLAAVLQLDPHVARARVERVLDQLLHGRRGALDDLARGDLVGDGVGQDGDASRHGENLAADRRDRRVRAPSLRSPAARTSAHPGARRSSLTALPPSTGAIAGASPWGESRSVAGSTTIASGRRYQARSPRPPMIAQAAKTSRIVQRSRPRGEGPAEPSHDPARATEQKQLFGRDRRRPGPASGGEIGRRGQLERAPDGGFAWSEPASLEPRRLGSPFCPIR